MIPRPPADRMSQPEPLQTDPLPDAVRRPAVSVVVPFAGSPAEAARTLAQVARLRLRMGDEAIVVDNQPGGAIAAATAPAEEGRRVLPDWRQPSSYYARNRGVEESGGEWLLFVDSDCRLPADLLDRFFAEPIPEDCGVVAGEVVSAPEQAAAMARWARTRNQVSETPHADAEHPAGITANLLVRRAAWDAAGGFHEGIRSGADIEFCWRIQTLGWSLIRRPAASVEHLHPEALRPLLRKAARYGAGRVWVNRRYPGRTPRQRLLGPLARCAGGALVWLVTLRPRRALHKVIDGLWFMAMARGGWSGDNRAPSGGTAPPGAPTVAGDFPEAGADAGAPPGVVEAAARPLRPDRLRARTLAITYREDDSPRARAVATVRVCLRRPSAALRHARANGLRGETGLAASAPAAMRLAGGPAPVIDRSCDEGRARALVALAGLRA